ncbi:MAG: hypothetical protein AAFW75_03660 [Cyanobacteria bacterium J06636_16]
MSSDKNNGSNVNPITYLTSIIGIFSIFLYFSGWIYRWAYFSFYGLDLNTIASSFPAQSFLFVPIQVVFGDLGNLEFYPLFRAVISVFIFFALYYAFSTLGSLLRSSLPQENRLPRIKYYKSSFIRNRLKIFTSYKRRLCSFLKRLFLAFLSFCIILLSSDPSKVLIPAAIILALLFWVSRIQGTDDARRDYTNSETRLHTIAIIQSGSNIPLGRELKKPEDVPDLENTHVIGDINLYRDLRLKDLNLLNTKEEMVWRLLLETDSQLYIFIGHPGKPSNDERPNLVSIPKQSDGAYSIYMLSPAPSRKSP